MTGSSSSCFGAGSRPGRHWGSVLSLKVCLRQRSAPEWLGRRPWRLRIARFVVLGGFAFQIAHVRGGRVARCI
eukprot:15453480-Alexandrium_andersonii.AAC.1